MDAFEALHRLRRFLLLLASGIFLGAVVELLLTGHFDGPTQFIPFGLAALGLLGTAAYGLRPSRSTRLGLRAILILLVIGSLMGVGQHLLGNFEFFRETRPDADAVSSLIAAFTGRNPVLAPGILAIGGILAFAAAVPEIAPVLPLK